MTNVIKVCQDRLHEMLYVPKTSYRDSLGYCGDVNKNFHHVPVQ
jgi:hypothetical protein